MLKRLCAVSLLAVVALAFVPALDAQTPTYKATISWADLSTNEDGFKIERNDGNAGSGPTPFVEIASVAANVVSFVDQPIAAGANHCWQIRSFNAAGKSAPSAAACATAPPAVTAPLPPGNVQIIITIAP